MRILVLEPKQVLYEGNAKEVVLCAEGEEFSVLDFHQPFLSNLIAGSIRINVSRQQRPVQIAIKKGIARMLKNELLVLAQV